MYGAKASKIEDKRRMMESAREHIYKAEQYMVQAGVDETDPDGIQRDMLDLIKRMQFSIEKAKNNYFFLVKELEAYE
jgi:predicted TIM-barrel enzyme